VLCCAVLCRAVPQGWNWSDGGGGGGGDDDARLFLRKKKISR
jgi:hypothetical protein